MQFVLELTIVTFLGIALGSGIGSVASAPVTNMLLASQIEYEQSNADKVKENFGREAGGDASAKPHGGDVEGEVTYVSTVQFQFDQMIVYKMAAIGALLALVSSAAAITFVLRYNPLEILAERD
jgi:putative ABC transport system permease protein